MSSAQDQSAQQAGSRPSGEAGRQYVPQPSRAADDSPRHAGITGSAYGLTIMAAVMMIISGLWNFFEGLAAVIRSGYFVSLPNYAFDMSVRNWGWFHLILGAVVFVAGVALFADMMWARVVGVTLAMVSAVVNFLYIPYYPFWSIVVIAIDVFVIWALMTPRHSPAHQ